MEKLSPYDQDPEQMDEFFEHLGDLGIDVNGDSDEELTSRSDDEERENSYNFV